MTFEDPEIICGRLTSSPLRYCERDSGRPQECSSLIFVLLIAPVVLVVCFVFPQNLSIIMFSSYVPHMDSSANEEKKMVMLRFWSLKTKTIFILLHFWTGYKG